MNAAFITLADALDAINLQLAADSDEVVLPRDAAALVAYALHDLLWQSREGARGEPADPYTPRRVRREPWFVALLAPIRPARRAQ